MKGDSIFKLSSHQENGIPESETWIARMKRLYLTHWWTFLLINLVAVISACSIFLFPVFLLPMNRVMIKLLIEGHCFWWDEFREEFRGTLFSGLLLGLCAVPLVITAGVLVTFLPVLIQAAAGAVLTVIMFFTAAWAWIVMCYAFSMKASTDLSILVCMRNSIILSFTEWKNNWKLLLLFLAFIFGLFMLPYSIPIWLLGGISLIVFLACGAVLPVIEWKVVNSEINRIE